MRSSEQDKHETAPHEPEALNIPGIWGAIGGVLLLLAISVGCVEYFFHWFSADAPPKHAGEVWRMQQTSPGVAPNQAYDRERLQSRETHILNSYAWQDPEQHRARIPIERAMQLLSERGLQPFQKENQDQPEVQKP